MNGYKNIYYNKYSNRIYLWKLDDEGRTVKKRIKPAIEYYIEDETKKSDIYDIWGNPVKKQVSRSMKSLKSAIEIGNLVTCEANIDQEIKYLQKVYSDNKIDIDIDNYNICTLDIEVEVGEEPKPFEQMVNECDNVINCITAHYSKTGKTYTWGNQEYTGDHLKDDPNWTYYYIPDESQMLTSFVKHFRRQHVDIVTGWNVKLFDMRYMIDRFEVLDLDLSFSPINITDEAKAKDNFGNTVMYYKIAGISILDGQELYKNFTYKKEVSYSLNHIATKVAGMSKIKLDDSINIAYKTNWNQFVEYNIVDVDAVRAIEDKKKFIELTITLCSQAMIPFEGVFSSIKVITGYMLSYLHSFGLVMPDVANGEKEAYPGAFVKAIRGVYNNLVSYDFASLYPTIIRMFNISPETLVMNPSEDEIPNLIKTPGSVSYKCETPKGEFDIRGIYFKKDKQGVLPKIVETIYFERVDFKNKAKVAKGIHKKYSVESIAKNNHWDIKKTQKIYDEVINEGYDEKYYDSQQMIRKILINSMYGVLGNRYFSFYNIKNAMAITIAGRDVIEYVSDSVNNYFHNHWHKTFTKYFPEYSHLKGEIPQIKNDMIPVVDTDSNYICLDEIISGLGLTFKDNEEYRLWVDDFDTRFLTPFFNKILKIYAKKYNAENLHDFKREKIIVSKLVLKKKKYADIVIENEGDVYLEPELSITGIDMVKTTTPSFFKNAATDILKTMLIERDQEHIKDKLRAYKEEFMNADISNISAPRSINNYSKWAEDVDTYIDNGEVYFEPKTPQHVRASMNFNYLIKKKKIMLPFIGNGSKVKVVYVNPNNILLTEIIAYVGDYPKEFDKYFRVDYETQWYKGFIKMIEDFYDAFDWGDVILEKTNINKFINY